MMGSSFGRRSLEESLNRLEPLAPLALFAQGAIWLFWKGGAPWQWAAVWGTGLLGVWCLASKGRSRRDVLIRASLIFILAWALLMATGGVRSVFLLWLFVLTLVYSCLLDALPARALLISVPASYLVATALSPAPIPIFAVLSRVFLLGFIGGTVRLFRLVLDHYVAQSERAEETLRENERYFRSATDHALDLITIVNSDGEIRYISPSVKRILGYEPSALVDQHLSALIHPDDWRDAVRYIEVRSSVGNVPTIELRVRHKNGTWRFLEVIGTYLVDDPDVAGIVLNSRDVSERKQLEQKLLQSKKMEAVGQLTAGIAHDFNNSLTIIGGFAELLQVELPEDDGLQAHLAEILHATKSSADLIRQLLVFSRKQVVEPQVLSINATVATMDIMLERTIGEGVELEMDLDPTLHRVKVDPTQVELALLNLAVNARDVMPTGGRLTIETKNVLLGERDPSRPSDAVPGEYVLLSVGDDGAGMSEEVKERVFEPFFSTKERGKGTGLGLATVYGVVKQSGGHITVKSELGSGTTFEIYFPVTDEEVAGVSEVEDEAGKSRGDETILLVEDDAGVRGFVRNVLTAQGYHLLSAEDGEEALHLSADAAINIDLLLTDVVMPGVSGDVLAKKVGATRPGLKVLYMSGYTEKKIAHLQVADARVSFLQKPFTPSALIRKVRRVLDRSPLQSVGTDGIVLGGPGDTGGCAGAPADRNRRTRSLAVTTSGSRSGASGVRSGPASEMSSELSRVGNGGVAFD